MLLSLAAADRRILQRGLAILAVIVIAGVTVVETQMNRLTLRQEFVQVASLRRDADGYWRAYAFGASAGVRAVYPLGTITSTDRTLTAGVNGRSVTMPTVLYMNIDRPLYWLEVWRRQFVTEAFKTREELAVLLSELRPFLKKLAEDARR